MRSADLVAMTPEQRDVHNVETCTTLEELDGLQSLWRGRGKILCGEVVAAFHAARLKLSGVRCDG